MPERGKADIPENGHIPIEALNSKNEEREARRRDFQLMQDILLFSARKRLWYSVGLWLFSCMSLWFVGAALFWVCERSQGWTYFTALYFAFTALLVIGYGDVTLQSRPGKAVFVLWSLIAVPTLTMLIATIVEAVGNLHLVVQKDWKDRMRFWKAEGKSKNALFGESTALA